MLPNSLMLLNTAHEYLGRRSWCCNSDGALLKFYVSLPLPAFCQRAAALSLQSDLKFLCCSAFTNGGGFTSAFHPAACANQIQWLQKIFRPLHF